MCSVARILVGRSHVALERNSHGIYCYEKKAKTNKRRKTKGLEKQFTRSFRREESHVVYIPQARGYCLR